MRWRAWPRLPEGQNVMVTRGLVRRDAILRESKKLRTRGDARSDRSRHAGAPEELRLATTQATEPTKTLRAASAPRAQSRANYGAGFLTFRGFIAAFGAASCCGLPIILASFGVGISWLLGPALIAEPYLNVFPFMASLSFAGAAALLWRSNSLTCAAQSVCARPMMRRVTLIGLLAGLVLLYLGYAYV